MSFGYVRPVGKGNPVSVNDISAQSIVDWHIDVDRSDYLAARVEEGFGNSQSGVILDKWNIQSADPNKRNGGFLDSGRGGRARLRAPSPDNLSLEEWENSVAYREELDFDADLSLPQHIARAQQYDETQLRRRIINEYDANFVDAVLGFGAEVMGSAASPETFVPIVGVAGKASIAARAAQMGLRGKAQNIAVGSAVGAIEGSTGAALVQPLVASHRNYMGDEYTAEDVVVDIVFSGVAGKILGGVGGVFSRARPVERDALADMADRHAENVAQGVDVDIAIEEKQLLTDMWARGMPTESEIAESIKKSGGFVRISTVEKEAKQRGKVRRNASVVGFSVENAGEITRFEWRRNSGVRQGDVTDFAKVISGDNVEVTPDGLVFKALSSDGRVITYRGWFDENTTDGLGARRVEVSVSKATVGRGAKDVGNTLPLLRNDALNDIDDADLAEMVENLRQTGAVAAEDLEDLDNLSRNLENADAYVAASRAAALCIVRGRG